MVGFPVMRARTALVNGFMGFLPALPGWCRAAPVSRRTLPQGHAAMAGTSGTLGGSDVSSTLGESDDGGGGSGWR